MPFPLKEQEGLSFRIKGIGRPTCAREGIPVDNVLYYNEAYIELSKRR